MLLIGRVSIWLMLFARFCSFLQVEEESEIVCLLDILRELSSFIHLPDKPLSDALLCLLIYTRMTQSVISRIADT